MKGLLVIAVLVAVSFGIFLPEPFGLRHCIHWFGPHGSGITCLRGRP